MPDSQQSPGGTVAELPPSSVNRGPTTLPAPGPASDPDRTPESNGTWLCIAVWETPTAARSGRNDSGRARYTLVGEGSGSRAAGSPWERAGCERRPRGIGPCSRRSRRASTLGRRKRTTGSGAGRAVEPRVDGLARRQASRGRDPAHSYRDSDDKQAWKSCGGNPPPTGIPTASPKSRRGGSQPRRIEAHARQRRPPARQAAD
jgi:hypothetical protein